MNIQFEEAPVSKFVFGNTKFSWVWLIARLYVGYSWIEAGLGKLSNEAWVGSQSGKAITGFVQGALAKTSGAHPDVQGWYATFLENVVLPHSSAWAHAITYGEIIVGIALIIGLFTGIAAFFGLFMNFNFLLAGTVSLNPILFVIQLFLVLAWRTAGYIGCDRYLLRQLGTFWQPGKLFNKS
jgi:thiosulfate dehydrogenase (quinone) large subunit